MPQTALYELAEATLGLAPEMQWSIDEGIARRESKRLFDRLADRTISPEDALEVFLITMQTKLEHSMSVLEERYQRLLATLTNEQQAQCPTLNEFFEFFTGLTSEATYASSREIAFQELCPLFAATYEGRIKAEQCQDAVFDNVNAKKEMILLTLQKSVQSLKTEIDEVVLSTKAKSDDR